MLLILIYDFFSPTKYPLYFISSISHAILCQKGRSGQQCFYEFPRRSSRWLAWISLVFAGLNRPRLCHGKHYQRSRAGQVLPLDPSAEAGVVADTRTGAGWGPGQRCWLQGHPVPPAVLGRYRAGVGVVFQCAQLRHASPLLVAFLL